MQHKELMMKFKTALSATAAGLLLAGTALAQQHNMGHDMMRGHGGGQGMGPGMMGGHGSGGSWYGMAWAWVWGRVGCRATPMARGAT
jgi:hypothetical protein